MNLRNWEFYNNIKLTDVKWWDKIIEEGKDKDKVKIKMKDKLFYIQLNH